MQKSVLLFLAICYSFFSLATCQERWWEECKATTLTTANWDQNVGKDQHVFIEFFGPHCVWCKRLVPEFNRLYDMYTSSAMKRKDVMIAKMNVPENVEIAVYRYGVQVYPTLVLFEKGSLAIKGVYHGDRTAEAMYNWIQTLAPPPPPKPILEELASLKEELSELKKRAEEQKVLLTAMQTALSDPTQNLSGKDSNSEAAKTQGYGFGSFGIMFVLGCVLGAAVGAMYKVHRIGPKD